MGKNNKKEEEEEEEEEDITIGPLVAVFKAFSPAALSVDLERLR